MKIRLLVVFLLSMFLVACGSVETGNVGIRTTFGKVSQEEEGPGFYTAVLSDVNQATVKEVEVNLEKLTPKAADNLSLDRLDISVFYVPTQSMVAEYLTRYKGQSFIDDDGLYYPGFHMVATVATSTVQGEVAKMNSLVIHTKREALENAVKANLQQELDAAVPGMFKVTRVVAKTIDTDDSIEENIQKVVRNQKELESMAVQEEIAKKQAQIEVTRANGIAQSNQIINNSLTREYLQHEANLALMEFAKNGNSKTVVIPSNIPTTTLIGIDK